MRAQVDCYPCILSQLSELAKKAVGTEEAQHALVKRLLRLVLEADEETTPPEFASMFHSIVAEISGIDDPWREVKERSTELGLAMLPDLQKITAQSSDPFEAAVRLAIGGNIIDYGVNPDFNLSEAEEKIREVFDLPFDRELCAELKRRLDAAHSIFYMLDNCGEAVIDRLLIEPYRDKITIGVRGLPILNDVTRREVALSGITDMPIVDTGDRAPGVSLRNSSRELLDAMESADVIIAKGQGNFESLDEGFTARPIFFLLRVKCNIVSRRVNSPLGSIKIIGENL
ncbi:MAG: ARMT1-like domain-containing protein [Victivallales bacterium]|jgi:uncharacterized protein with ATP-grasp and redox domains|nr:ARMT1-like domain-containing protein [Victivallales bacterium]